MGGYGTIIQVGFSLLLLLLLLLHVLLLENGLSHFLPFMHEREFLTSISQMFQMFLVASFARSYRIRKRYTFKLLIVFFICRQGCKYNIHLVILGVMLRMN